MQLKNTSYSFYLSALAYVPLAVFLLYPKFKSYLYYCNVEWQEPFYFGALFAIVITAFQIITKTPIDTLMLGANLFLVFGAFSFLFNIGPCLYILGNYKGVTFFACLLIAALAMLFFSSKKEKSELFTLTAVISGLLFSTFFTKDQNIFISIALPFIALRFLEKYLQKSR